MPSKEEKLEKAKRWRQHALKNKNAKVVYSSGKPNKLAGIVVWRCLVCGKQEFITKFQLEKTLFCSQLCQDMFLKVAPTPRLNPQGRYANFDCYIGMLELMKEIANVEKKSFKEWITEACLERLLRYIDTGVNSDGNETNSNSK